MRIWKDSLSYLLSLGKWTLLALLTGILGGGIGALFLYLFDLSVSWYQKIPWLFCLLPLFGLLIVLLYRILRREADRGTNEVILTVQTGTAASPLTMPLIMAGTLLTQLGGGSAGKEGAALQIGGSLGSSLACLFRLPGNGKTLLSLCGMSAVFSAVFGTPFTAALFVLEFTSVGVIHISAFPVCFLSSLAALSTARFIGAAEAPFPVPEMPAFSFLPLGSVLILSLAAGIVSILFCLLLHGTEDLFGKLLPNRFMRVAAGGLLLVLLTFLLRDFGLNGSGAGVISSLLSGKKVFPFFFILKMLFTAVTIGSGYKGGEIVPTLAIGAGLGALAAPLLSLDPAFGAAVGMVALFSGVTNCAVAAAALGAELFGWNGVLFFALASAVSYAVSGNFSLYKTQRVFFSKVSGRITD